MKLSIIGEKSAIGYKLDQGKLNLGLNEIFMPEWVKKVISD